jgi:cell shape-determining protein MreD
MAILISIPIFISLTILQAGILSRTPLLNGSIDLVLLVILAWTLHERSKSIIEWSLMGGLIASLSTALPIGTLLIAYLSITGIALYIKRILWKVPILAMFAATFLGTLILLGTSWVAVILQGTLLPIDQVINWVLLPSLLLNLLAAVPVYILTSDLANWVYPEEL